VTQPDRVALPGSHRAEIVGARYIDGVEPVARIEFTAVLRRRAELPDSLVIGPDTITTAELADRHGADDADVALVSEEFAAAGVTVIDVHAGSRRLRAAGTVAAVNQLFGTQLRQVRSLDPWGQPVDHRTRSGDLGLPGRLSGVVVAVLGLDDRPQARPRLRRLAPHQSPAGSFAPPALATAYNFPATADGTGQTAAIIELGGGYAQQDLDTYFKGLNIPTPSVRSVGVDGASNGGGTDPQGADGEVLLDIEVIGGLAPKASQVVYFAPNTDSGFLDAVSTAVHASPTPTVVSISWGQSEDQWTAQSRSALDQAFADAAALGVTVTTAAGDNGSGDNVTDGVPHADFPASSPHALACGGTSLVVDTSGKATAETVWNDTATGGGATGGGVSDVFPVPSWQANVGVPKRASSGGGPGRGVPDVAGDADPQTGYQVRVDGTDQVFGGTSAVAPLWAALICRLAQLAGKKFGLVQPLIYAGATAGKSGPGFRDVTSGTNGAYSAGPGWDACTGLGVPDGTALQNILK
jgi:kumamolisin